MVKYLVNKCNNRIFVLSNGGNYTDKSKPKIDNQTM